MSDAPDPPIWRATATVAGWTAASRVLGFARDILIAATLGAGPLADAFFIALKLPNLFRRLFGEGAFAAAFVPAYTGLAATDPPAAAQLAGRLATLMLLGLGAIVIAGEIAMPLLMHLFAPGFVATPARFALAVTLTRITFPYLLLICLAALVGGMLNGVGKFAAPAAAPVLFNLVCIAALLTLSRTLPTPAHAIALGVTLAGGAQLAMLWGVAARAAKVRGSAPGPRLGSADPGPHFLQSRPAAGGGANQVLRRMAPGLLGAGVAQVNVAVGLVIASLLPAGTVSALYYADRVSQLPIGLVGAALGTALLPALSRDHHRGDPAAAAVRLNRAIELAMALALPAAVALLVLARPVMLVLFGRGAFGPDAVARSAAMLGIYALGLPASVLVRLLAPACFARGDTSTPVRTGAAAVAVNLLLGLMLIRPLGLVAPAAAASVAATVNAALLGISLHRRGLLHADAALRRALPRLAAAAAVMGAAAAFAAALLRPLFIAPGPARAIALGTLVVIGLLSFAAAGQALGGFDLRRRGRVAL